MKRLTFSKNGEWGLRGVDLRTIPRELYGVVAKLRDYENTGYTPDEVEEIAYWLDDLKKAIAKNSSCEGCIHYHDGEYDPTCEECCRAYEDDYYETEAENGKPARWIESEEDGYKTGYYHCSECLEVSDWHHKFCPNCGAKMEERR